MIRAAWADIVSSPALGAIADTLELVRTGASDEQLRGLAALARRVPSLFEELPRYTSPATTTPPPIPVAM